MYITEWISFVGALFSPAFMLFMAWWIDDSPMTMAFTFFGTCALLHMHKFDKPECKN